VWFLGLVFTLIKGKWMNMMGSEFLDLDLVTIMTAYLFLSYGNIAVGIFAFGQGLFIDILSGGLHGLSAFLYLVIFGAIYVGSPFFNLLAPKGQIIIIASAVFFKKIIFLIVLSLFSSEIVFSKSFLWISVVSVISTGLISPILFYLFSGLRGILIANSGDNTVRE
jgi:rod shape-determining protein MreD